MTTTTTSSWKAQRVTIMALFPGDRPVTVDARVLGTLAVHGGLGYEHGYWVITHLPTGYAVGRGETLEGALRIGFTLWARWRGCLRLKTVAEVRAAASPWMIAWLKRCNADARYYDPEEFRR